MSRTARVIAPGCPHHVIQRGNNQNRVFFTEDDRRLYLNILTKQAARHGLVIEGYCLMTNHVHLVATPASETSLARAIGRTHWVYTQKINRRKARSGHLWQGRFYSCPMDDAYFLTALAYVELNPVRAGMCEGPGDYEWSSARFHLGEGGGIINRRRWERLTVKMGVDWAVYLKAFEPGLALSHLRACTSKGLPAGDKKFTKRLERLLNLHFIPRAAGRPRRKENVVK